MVSFPKEFLEAVDKSINDSTFQNRAEFIRYCIREELKHRGCNF